jgi:hypothetical protein
MRDIEAKTQSPVVCKFEEQGNWGHELFRLRLQGLGERDIENVAEEVKSDEVARRLNEIKHQRPITAKSVPS